MNIATQFEIDSRLRGNDIALIILLRVLCAFAVIVFGFFSATSAVNMALARSAKPAGDVTFRQAVPRVGEDGSRITDLDQIPEMEIRRT